jgi:hypothetical protein
MNEQNFSSYVWNPFKFFITIIGLVPFFARFCPLRQQCNQTTLGLTFDFSVPCIFSAWRSFNNSFKLTFCHHGLFRSQSILCINYMWLSKWIHQFTLCFYKILTVLQRCLFSNVFHLTFVAFLVFLICASCPKDQRGDELVDKNSLLIFNKIIFCAFYLETFFSLPFPHEYGQIWPYLGPFVRTREPNCTDLWQ